MHQYNDSVTSLGIIGGFPVFFFPDELLEFVFVSLRNQRPGAAL